MSPKPPRLHAFQLVDSDAAEAVAAPGFELLTTHGGERPDWGGYWPVRQFLLGHPLDEQAFYGFFGATFKQRTGWQHADVAALLQDGAQDIDVALFSPHPTHIALFVNVFEQGEFLHPGLKAVCRDWLHSAGIQLPLDGTVMGAKQTVFGNFFVARPDFWRTWLTLGEKLFAVCEGPPTALQGRLTTPLNGAGDAQAKVHVIERMASLVLAADPRWRVSVADPYRHGLWASEALRRDPTTAICSDALKHAFRNQPFPEYLSAFSSLRQQFVQQPQP